MDNQRIDLPQGTLDLLILKTVALSPQHGWAISERIQQISSDVLCVQQGSLYPALHRLERRGWISARWGASENNRRAKYYELTKAGRKQLESEAGVWRKLALAVARFWTPSKRVSPDPGWTPRKAKYGDSARCPKAPLFARGALAGERCLSPSFLAREVRPTWSESRRRCSPRGPLSLSGRESRR